MYQNIRSTRAVLGGKFIALSGYFNKEEFRKPLI